MESDKLGVEKVKSGTFRSILWLGINVIIIEQVRRLPAKITFPVWTMRKKE